MTETEYKIQQLSRKEVATKCIPSSYFFSIFAIIIFFYGFHTERYLTALRVMCAVSIISCIFRFFFARKFLETSRSEALWNQLKLSIVVNSVAWGVVFALATYELEAQGPHFAMVLAVMTGFVSASIHTLSYDPFLFISYQLLSIVPQLGFFLYAHFIKGSENAYMFALTYALYLAYQFRFYREHRKQIFDRFNFMVNLKKSNEELATSQQALVAQTTKLMHASRLAALGDMSAGLAHEINNPLMVIQGSTEQIERSIKQETEETKLIRNRTEKTKAAVSKIKTIIEGLQYFSQEKEIFVREPLKMQDVVSHALHFCAEMMKVHEVHLTVEPLPEVKVSGDNFQLVQVIFNLIKNADDALQSIPNRSERWIKISGELVQDRILIRISNGGEKIGPLIAEKLFQPFFTTKEIGKSIGLSLSISKGIAQAHQGNLYHDSAHPFTTFVLELPVLK